MKIRRWSAAGIAAILFTPGLAACDNTGGDGASTSLSPSATSTNSTEAKQALLDSTREISNGNFRFLMSGDGLSATGMVHMPSRSAQMTLLGGQPSDDISMKVDLIYIEPESWVKMRLDGGLVQNSPQLRRLNNDKYHHLDQTKTKDLKSLRFDFDKVDPAGSELLTRGITEVKMVGEGSYQGTLDVSQASEAGALNADVIKALGAQGTAVPFTAKLDSQGRLSELILQMPAAGESKAHEIKITYSDYGAAIPAQQPPAGQVVEAPDELYELFR